MEAEFLAGKGRMTKLSCHLIKGTIADVIDRWWKPLVKWNRPMSAANALWAPIAFPSRRDRLAMTIFN
jgi:hypothetical protein